MLNEEVTEGCSISDTEAEAVKDSVASTLAVALSLGSATYDPEAEPLTD